MTRAPRASALALLLAACAAPDAPDLELSELPAAEPEVRPDTPGNGLQFNFDTGDLVEAYPSAGGRFLIHFTRAGTNKVPAADADTSGVPDFVEQVADVYDEVLAKYEALGFRAPLDDGAVADNGGDDRFDVYLVDFAGVGDGNFQQDGCPAANGDQCRGYMIQENDFAGYGYPSTLIANRILGSHEFFHAVQAAYDVDQGSVLAEGTAVWATEQFDPTLDDFEWFVPGYFENTDRPIDEPLPGPADPFSYGTGIFFQFLEEAHGPGLIRALWERCENGANGVGDPAWLEVIDGTLADEAGTTFPDAFLEFATWNLYTDDFADPTEAYAAGAGYPRVRIDTLTAPHSDDQLRVYRASAQYYALAPEGRGAMTAALVAPTADATATDGLKLVLATETGSSLAVTPIADASAGTETIDTSSASRLVVVVVNGALTGESKKPGFCVGTVDEVAACKAALGVSGTGGSGGGTTGSGGGGADGGETGGGCDCRASASGSGSTGALVLGLGLALQALRRRAKSKPTSAA